MFWLYIIAFIILSVYLLNKYFKNRESKSKKIIENFVEPCITLIEKNPQNMKSYDNLIKTLRSHFGSLDGMTVLESGCYDRILKICQDFSGNIKTWEVLEELLKNVNIAFSMGVSNKYRVKTLKLLKRSLSKEINNKLIQHKIIVLIKELKTKKEEIHALYNKILKICEEYSSEAYNWELLSDVIQELEINFGDNITGKTNRANTFILLADSLEKEFENPPIKDKLLDLVDTFNTANPFDKITEHETQDLYNAALKILEAHPDNVEAKKLALYLGRLHYTTVRNGKKLTVYDEQAIQNDIAIRSK